MKELQALLEELGFTHAESITYLTLLKLGKSKSGRIIEQTELQSSVVHNALNTLIVKGYVNFVQENRKKTYQAASPELIERAIEEKRRRMHEALPMLKALQAATAQSPEIKVYEGFGGLLTATLEAVEGSKKGTAYKYFAAQELTEEALQFFAKVDELKREHGIIVKGIAHTSMKKGLRSYKHSTLRFTDAQIPPAMNIIGDRIILFSLSGRPSAVLIRSPELASQYHKLWDEIWFGAK